jgi:preprotein translocase subunit SecA
MNDQRREVYAQRREYMSAADVSETVSEMRHELIDAMVRLRIPEKAFAEQWETAELAAEVKRIFDLDLPIEAWGREEGIDETAIRERLEQAANSAAAAKAANFGPEIIRYVEKSLLLQMFDTVWKEHLLALDHLRQGIGLRAYGQRDPLNEYKSEAFVLFNAMLDDLRERVITTLSRVTLSAEPPPPSPELSMANMRESHPDANFVGGTALMEPVQVSIGQAVAAMDPNDPTTWGGTQRNAACPCGSGKKYKHCHGRA